MDQSDLQAMMSLWIWLVHVILSAQCWLNAQLWSTPEMSQHSLEQHFHHTAQHEIITMPTDWVECGLQGDGNGKLLSLPAFPGNRFHLSCKFSSEEENLVLEGVMYHAGQEKMSSLWSVWLLAGQIRSFSSFNPIRKVSFFRSLRDLTLFISFLDSSQLPLLVQPVMCYHAQLQGFFPSAVFISPSIPISHQTHVNSHCNCYDDRVSLINRTRLPSLRLLLHSLISLPSTCHTLYPPASTATALCAPPLANVCLIQELNAWGHSVIPIVEMSGQNWRCLVWIKFF